MKRYQIIAIVVVYMLGACYTFRILDLWSRLQPIEYPKDGIYMLSLFWPMALPITVSSQIDLLESRASDDRESKEGK